MFLPALTLAIAMCPTIIRSLRATTINVLGSDYVGTARSKGARRAVACSARTCSATPPSRPSRSSASTSATWSAARWSSSRCSPCPGLGSLMINAIFSRDFPDRPGRHPRRGPLRDRRRTSDRRRLHAPSTRGSTSAARSGVTTAVVLASRAMRRPAPVAAAAALVPQRHAGAGHRHRRPAGARGRARAAAHALRPDQAGPRRTRCSRRARSTGWAPTSTAATSVAGCSTGRGSTCGSASSPC